MNNQYTTTESVPMIVESVTDVYGNPVSTADYEVTYFEDNGDFVLNSSDKVVQSKEALDQRSGGIPTKAGVYFVVVSDIIPSNSGATTPDAIKDTWAWDTNWANTNYKSQLFTVTAETTSIADAFAYQVQFDNEGKATKSVTDTEFKYTGNEMEIGFAVGSKALASGDYNIAWVGTALDDTNSNGYYEVTDAGTYTAVLTGKGSETTGGYVGTKTVTITVDPIDLDNDEIYIAPTDKLYFNESNKTQIGGADAWTHIDTDQIYVNGEQLATGLNDELSGAMISQGSDSVNYVAVNPVTSTFADSFTFQLVDKNFGGNNNVIGSAKAVTAQVVNQMVSYTYKDQAIESSYNIDTTYGDSFNTDYLAGTYTSDGETYDATFSTTIVNSKGEEVGDMSTPDTYTVTLETTLFTFEGKTYAGYETFMVNVIGRDYDDATAFVSVDGKTFTDETDGVAKNVVDYDTEAVPVRVAAKDGNETLVEGTDYTVAITDADSEAVESVVEPGTYTVTVSFADGKNKVEVTFAVLKAQILSAEPTADFFALPEDGSAAVPTFAGSTDAVFEDGLQFDLAAEEISVEYYKAEPTYGSDGVQTGWVKTGDAIEASELTEAGDYIAEITVLTNAQYIRSNGEVSAHFVLSEVAGYADVDANAWYADEVYQAKEFGYMTGIPGTNLFLPAGDISRAQTAQVLYNMAGGPLAGTGTSAGWFPTEFSDVEAWAWYAEPILWASQAGVVTGYGETGTFGPNDDVTREQAATMLYRYMKAQGKDVSGAADLSGYADSASVSGWAAEAMAWAVDAEVFGVGTDQLRPQENLSRAEMAAIAVRVQPDGAIEAL